MKLILPLERCPLDVGSKANRLRALLAAGLPVPEAYVISADDLAAEKSQELAADVRELMDTVFRGAAVVVRSSAADEDTPLASAAGVYESYLDRRTADEVLDAIAACRASAVSADADAYRVLHGRVECAPMHVIVQRMADCRISGVLYTRNPVAEDATMLVETSRGLGTRVVAGLGADQRFTLSRSAPEPRDRDRADRTVSEEDLPRTLQELGLALEAEFGCPQDVEWGLADGRLFVFQSRDIVVPPVPAPLRATRPAPSAAPAADLVLSPGYGIGVPVTVADGRPAPLGSVAVLDHMPTASRLDLLKDASALVLREGNALSHSAALTRELGLPAILLTDPHGLPTDRFAPDGSGPGGGEAAPVLVDAVRGQVTRLVELPPVERKKAVFAAMRQAGLRGLPGHHYQGRYETVLFDPVAQNRVLAQLRRRGIGTTECVQRILPYDDPARTYCGISARIQVTADACRVQFKRANLLPDRPYRFDEEVHVRVDTPEAGADLLRGLLYVARPAQERRISRAEVDGVRLQFNLWPGARHAYLGLESELPGTSEEFLRACDVPLAECEPLDGKDLFDMLGIGLEDLHFGARA
ncbi:PEP/pyruvate-binding domain-containing protein [Streptomyces incarnatus]